MLPLLRALAILDGAAVIGCVAAYLFSGKRGYLGWATRLLQLGVALGLVFFSVLIVERIVG